MSQLLLLRQLYNQTVNKEVEHDLQLMHAVLIQDMTCLTSDLTELESKTAE